MLTKLLHNILEKSCESLHKKVRDSMVLGIDGLLRNKQLTVTALGRALNTETTAKHNIKRMDRLLNNVALQRNRIALYKAVTEKIVGNEKWLPLLVDPCCLTTDSTLQLFRVSIPDQGRALTIYEEVYTNEVGNLIKVQKRVLQVLKKILPSTVKPIFIADAGFHTSWSQLVESEGWNWISRIRQNKMYSVDGKNWLACKGLYEKATERAEYIGEVELSKKHGLKCHFYRVKKKLKGRVHKNKKGSLHKGSYSRVKSKAQREPWLLATSLSPETFNAKKIISLYTFRMQIEEAFRDLKNTRYGLRLRHCMTRIPKRLSILLLMGMLANFLAWLVGKAAEKKKQHYAYQANTIKTRRVLSFFYLGIEVIKRGLQKISLKDLQEILEKTKRYEFC